MAVAPPLNDRDRLRFEGAVSVTETSFDGADSPHGLSCVTTKKKVPAGNPLPGTRIGGARMVGGGTVGGRSVISSRALSRRATTSDKLHPSLPAVLHLGAERIPFREVLAVVAGTFDSTCHG